MGKRIWGHLHLGPYLLGIGCFKTEKRVVGSEDSPKHSIHPIPSQPRSGRICSESGCRVCANNMHEGQAPC